MIYALPDLARGIGRSLARRGLRATVTAPTPDRLMIADADEAALEVVDRAAAGLDTREVCGRHSARLDRTASDTT